MNTEYTLIDPAVLMNAAGDDVEDFKELLAMFLRIVPDIVGQLEQAVREDSLALVAQHAHSLKSCLSLVGAVTCAAQLEALERAALRREAGCGAGFDGLREELDGVIAQARTCHAATAQGAPAGQDKIE
jgi:HPt (histidine-containing phosphotransfer) domain-containing protein